MYKYESNAELVDLGAEFIKIPLVWKSVGPVCEYVEAAILVKAENPEARFILVRPSVISNKAAITDEEISQKKK